MENQEFKHLFSPIKIGTATLPNRIVMSGAINRLFGGGESHVQYFAARAKGGAGLIISAPPLPYILSDAMFPEFKRIADVVHQYPTKIFAQLVNLGAREWVRMTGSRTGMAPSSFKVRFPFKVGYMSVPHAMDKDEIEEMIKIYGAAAAVAKKAGYDGVEIMGAWGFLPAEFLSPIMNMRDDEYGGSLEKRVRFILRLIDSIRDNVGPDFPLGVRFTADELAGRMWWTKEKGNTLDEAKEIAKILEASGKLNYLFACADTFGPGHVPPMYFPLGAFTYISAGIKEVVDLPVVVVGRINDPVMAETVLVNGQADLIGMTRAVICDPEMPNKAKEGRLEEIRRCIACNEGCIGPDFVALPIACALNYETGREHMGTIKTAEKKKNVMIVGGGAAGLEAARVAALRGHKVDLYEKNDVLAKELDISAKAPGRQDFAEVKRYLTYQMKLLNVNVHMGVTVTPEMVIQQNPDAVVIATGGLPFVPEIPGANTGNVVEMRQVLTEQVEVGQNVLVVDYQNHLYGLDTADFLAERGKKVELITEHAFAGTEVDVYTIESAYFNVLNRGVVITPLTDIKEIKGKTVIAYNILTNVEREISGIDTVVVCADEKANDSLYYSLKGKVKELHLIGQALSPRKLLDSIADAYVMAKEL